MLSHAYAIVRWVEYASGGLALIALAAIVSRLRRKPRRQVLGAVVALVVASGLCLGSYAFLGTRVVEVSLGSIKQIGLELKHSGLRTDAVRYDTQVSITVALRAPGVLGTVTKYLIHKTTTVNTQIAVYGLIDFTTVDSKIATVDRQARTITLSLPDPEIGKNTIYIAAVDGVQQRDGPLTAVAQGVTGIIGSLFHLPVVSVNPEPELALAEAHVLKRAQRSLALESCGKQEIVAQLTGIFHLVPAYRGYRVLVHWPTPPDTRINCPALQSEFAHSGSA